MPRIWIEFAGLRTSLENIWLSTRLCRFGLDIGVGGRI